MAALKPVGCACGIDVHAHVVPEHFPAYLGRTVPAPCEMGLATQVVSPMPELLSYWLDPPDARGLIRFLNEHTAALCAESGGRLLGLLLPRLQQGWRTFPALAESISVAPVEQARRLYFDTLVYDAPTLRHLVATFGTHSLMLGTDYPFNFHEPRPLARLEEAGLDAATRDALAFGNVRRFLGVRAGLPKESR